MATEPLHDTKTCRKCGESKPATEEFFHREKRGLKGTCRPCRLFAKRVKWAERDGAIWRAKYAANPSKRSVIAAAWRVANSDRYVEYNRRRYAKLKADPKARLSSNISCHIYQTLKGTKAGRSWQPLVGYSVEDLRAHLERQFIKGMTWGSYGEWHIDHIRPVASFRFSSPDDPEFRACWALSNLRPLWARDNILKSDKLVSLL
jgi:hypothetical protein